MTKSYKDQYSLERRSEESKKILDKYYPKRIPIILERAKNTTTTTTITIKNTINGNLKNKYLVPSEITVGQFMYIIRKKIKVSSEIALFFFVGERSIVPPTSMIISHLYNEYKDTDGFLYVVYSQESTFGN